MFSSIFKNFSIQRVGISHETAFNEDSGKAFRAPPLGGGVNGRMHSRELTP